MNTESMNTESMATIQAFEFHTHTALVEGLRELFNLETGIDFNRSAMSYYSVRRREYQLA